jgi:monoamine oxidase
MDCDAIIVGGGLAGTRAATKLKAGGASVLLLEARDRLGGRTWTRNVGATQVDFGAQFIGPGQPRMHALVRELGLQTMPTWSQGQKRLELRGEVTSYSGTIPFRTPGNLLRLAWNFCRTEWMSRRLPAGEPWRAPRAAELDSLTLQQWLGSRPAPASNVDLLNDAVIRTVFGADPSELSAFQFLSFVASNGGYLPIVETRGGFQQDRIVGGTQQISERLGDALGRDSVLTNSPVQAIHDDGNGITARSGSRTWRSRRVVVALPLGTARQVAFEPLLPFARHQLHDRCAMGRTIKVFATYDRTFWREQGLSGEAVGTSGHLSVTFDNTTYDGTPCLLGFIVGRAANNFAALPPERRRAEVLGELARLFGRDAMAPRDYAEADWAQETYSGGCPLANFTPGTLSAAGHALRTPVGRIHWAGTETARQCTGYMEGAVESGDRAAEEVLAAL